MTKQAKRKYFRSGKAYCDICNQQRPLVEHHLNGRNVQNWRDGWNISTICANCHDSVHIGDIIIVGWFQTTNGRKLIWHRKGEEITDYGEPAQPPIWKNNKSPLEN